MRQLSANEAWQARRPANLPTYRQIQYWAEHGALGERLRGCGSGFYRQWTDEDFERLAVIKQLADDVAAAGLTVGGRGRGGLGLSLVADVWRQLCETGRAVVERGAVRIEVSVSTPQAAGVTP